MLLLAATGLALLAGEVALRVAGFSHPSFYRPDPWRGWSLRPGAEGPWRQEGSSRVSINAAGLRDEEHPQARPSGVLRVAVLGDSCVEALQVEHEETFAERLERDLAACPALGGRRVEALNFGVSGYGTAQELLTLRREAVRYRPDVVLLAFYPGNDVVNNSRVLDGNRRRPYFVPREGAARQGGSGAEAPQALGSAEKEELSVQRAPEAGEDGTADPAASPIRAGGPRARGDTSNPAGERRLPATTDLPELALDLSFRDEPGFRFRTALAGRLLYRLADRSHLIQAAKPARVAWQRWRADRRREGRPAGDEEGLDAAIYRPPASPRWQEAWTVTETLIRTMDREATTHGARFGVVVLTSGIQVHPDPRARRAFAERLRVADLLYPDRRLEALGRRAGFPVLSLTPALQDLAIREQVYLHGFPNTAMGLGHWNAQGHRAAARLIALWLCRDLAAGPERLNPRGESLAPSHETRRSAYGTLNSR